MIKISEKLWDNIDFEIRPLIKLLNDNDFKTFCSCSGEDGHAFKFPTVLLQYESSIKYKKLIKLLIDNEIYGFEISEKKHYKNLTTYSDVHIELVLYNLNRLRLSLLNKKENDEIKEKYRTKKYTQKQLAEEYELDIWDIKSILNNRKYWI